MPSTIAGTHVVTVDELREMLKPHDGFRRVTLWHDDLQFFLDAPERDDRGGVVFKIHGGDELSDLKEERDELEDEANKLKLFVEDFDAFMDNQPNMDAEQTMKELQTLSTKAKELLE